MITGKAPPLGTQVVDFELPDEANKIVRLSELVKDGPILIFFYPTDFGMLCTMQMGEVRDKFHLFKEAGARVIGISTNTSRSHGIWQTNMNLPFTLLSDVDGNVARAFGVLCPNDTMMKGRACRSAFLISKEGKLLYVWMPEDTHKTPNIEELVENIRKFTKR